MKYDTPLLTVLLAMTRQALRVKSNPLIEAWSRLRRLKLPRWGAVRMALASELGEVTTASKSTELREQAAAKFKEAHDHMEATCKEAGTTMEALQADESLVPQEALTQFDAIMVDAQELRAQYETAAKQEGRFEGVREGLDYFHSKATGNGPIPWAAAGKSREVSLSLGQMFTHSPTYKALMDSGILHSEGGKFITDRMTSVGSLAEFEQTRKEAIDGGMDEIKAFEELLSKAAADIIHTGSGNEGDALVLDQFLPGILQLPQRPLTIRALFASGRATSDTVSYAAQVNFDSGAAMVAQATGTGDGAKPQSSIRWERRTRPIETLATFMAATRQQMADAPQVESLIDNQGRLMLQLEEEAQLLSGSGSTPNLQGVLSETGVQTLDVTNGVDADTAGINNISAIRTAKRMVRTGAARMAADAIVMHPNDSEEFDLLRDGNGLFRGGNPIGNFTFNQSFWGLRRVESEAIAEGTALVGAFNSGATVLERMPITVFTTDSHSDWFIRNLIAVLFEERFGFPIFFPAAFVNMTLAGWDGGS